MAGQAGWGRVVPNLWPWILGLVALALVPALLPLVPAASNWVPIYWAGAIGGLMLELFQGGWGLELPAMTGQRPSRSSWLPVGPWIDIGVLGRMTAGGVGAVVFLILVNVVIADTASDELSALADRLDTLAWAVAIGAASPALWALGARLVKARITAMEERQRVAQEIVRQADQALTQLSLTLSAPGGQQEMRAEGVNQMLAEVEGMLRASERILIGEASGLEVGVE
jgi:hypothetical protein